MTKNIIKLKLLIIFLFISCNDKNNKTLYYNFYNSKDSISLFIIKSVDIKDNKRKEIDSFFNTKGKLENIKHNTFIVDDYSLNKVTTKTTWPYLTIKNKNCIEYIFDNELATFAHTKYCFIERTNVIINEKSYLNINKFLRITGTIHGIESIVYLDKDFISLKEEFLNGYGNKYKIEKLIKLNL